MKIKGNHFNYILQAIISTQADEVTLWHLAQAMMLFDSGEYDLDSLILIGYHYHTVSELFCDFGIDVKQTSFPPWVNELENKILKEINSF